MGRSGAQDGVRRFSQCQPFDHGCGFLAFHASIRRSSTTCSERYQTAAGHVESSLNRLGSFSPWVPRFSLWLAVGTMLWVAAIRVSRFLPEPIIEATGRKGPFLFAGGATLPL